MLDAELTVDAKLGVLSTLLMTTTMMSRNVHTNTARPTATDTCDVQVDKIRAIK